MDKKKENKMIRDLSYDLPQYMLMNTEATFYMQGKFKCILANRIYPQYKPVYVWAKRTGLLISVHVKLYLGVKLNLVSPADPCNYTDLFRKYTDSKVTKAKSRSVILQQTVWSPWK